MVSLLVNCHDLASRLATDNPPVVLDARWALGGPAAVGEYRAGHIPGAHFVDLDTELSAPPGPGRHPLPDARDFGTAMRRHGVSSGRSVVVYDAATGMSAARAWWLLRYFGHGDVSLLDGGFAAWRAAHLPVTSGDVHHPDAGDFDPVPGHMPLLDATGALALARSGVLVDARAPERFRGETEPVDPIAGHIAGAVNLPAQRTLSTDGHFLPAGELVARFSALGIAAGEPVGVYCGSGVVAAQEVFAMALAGIEASLYAGSWSEWITDRARLVELGDAQTAKKR